MMTVMVLVMLVIVMITICAQTTHTFVDFYIIM
jgi:hypothetical protein